jgi:hypothetical protein
MIDEDSHVPLLREYTIYYVQPTSDGDMPWRTTVWAEDEEHAIEQFEIDIIFRGCIISHVT